MRILIASDLHGSAYYARKLLEAWDREKPDRTVLLGDLLYHGPRNDLPKEYDPKQVISLLNARRDSLLCVRGNCDTEVDQMVLQFPILADYAWIAADTCSLFATHGHVYHPDHLPPLAAGDILLYGHTHVPAWEMRGGVRCFNPGSVSIPKGDSARGYMMFENDVFQWKTLDGEMLHSETAD
jgi:putative phosphoesterase